MSTPPRFQEIGDNLASGQYGFVRVGPGQTALASTTSETKVFGTILATEDAVFGAGCEVEVGQPPLEDDAVMAEHIRVGRFTKVVCKTGILYCYAG